MKTCRKCGEEKPLEEFAKDKARKDGRLARCKTCVNATFRAAHKRRMQDPEYREKRQTKLRAYAKANPGASSQRMRVWRQRNPEKARAKSTAASRKLRERDPEYHRRWYQAHIDTERERVRLYMRAWRQANPERARNIARRFRARHPDRIREWERENTNRRRALMRASSPETARHMTELLTEPCAYCGATEQITVDHIVPLSRGGKHEPANLAPACLSCNCSKGSKTLEEWLGSGGSSS